VTFQPLWRVLQRNDADAADLAALPFATEHEKKTLAAALRGPHCEACDCVIRCDNVAFLGRLEGSDR